VPSGKITFKTGRRINDRLHPSQGGWGDGVIDPRNAGIEPHLLDPRLLSRGVRDVIDSIAADESTESIQHLIQRLVKDYDYWRPVIDILTAFLGRDAPLAIPVARNPEQLASASSEGIRGAACRARARIQAAEAEDRLFDFLTTWKLRYTAASRKVGADGAEGGRAVGAEDVKVSLRALAAIVDDDELRRAARALDTTTTAATEEALLAILRESEFPPGTRVPMDRLLVDRARPSDMRAAAARAVVRRPRGRRDVAIDTEFADAARRMHSALALSEPFGAVHQRWLYAVSGRVVTDSLRNARDAKRKPSS
jgi:hypothetical protein